MDLIRDSKWIQMYKILLNPRWTRVSLRVDLDQEPRTSGSDRDPIRIRSDRMGIKLKKGTEALDEASDETWRRETDFLLLLYIHLLFFFSCKISKKLLINRKPAPAAAGEFLFRQVNFFAISSSPPRQSDGRSSVSCFLFPVFRGSVQRGRSQTRHEVTFDFFTCLFFKCSLLFFLNKKTPSFSLF